MKICFKCKTSKEVSEFGVRKDTGRLTSYCNECEAGRSRAAHAKNPTAKKQSKLKWKQNNETLDKQAKSDWFVRNPEYKKNWEKTRYREVPEFRTMRCLRARLRSALRGLGIKKTGPTVSLLGCPVSQLRVYLESLFKSGMTWENHGPVWHIDHKRPCASFDLTDPEQQRMCFHWTNLQPLFALDNLRKGDTYDFQAA